MLACSSSLPELALMHIPTLPPSHLQGTISVKALDLCDLTSVKAFATAADADLPRLDLLILNAGVMACPLTRTKQGFEQQIGVNHIAHFYLTQLLLPKLKASGTAAAPARVVAVSSSAHNLGKIVVEDLNYENRWYNNWSAYGQSKLANVLFASELAKRMKEEGAPVLAYSLHPGVIQTNLQRHMGWTKALLMMFKPAMKSIPQGAATTVVAATAEGLPSGAFLADCAVTQPNKKGRDAAMAAALWEKTEELVKAAAV